MSSIIKDEGYIYGRSYYLGRCSRTIREIEYHPDGNIKSIAFWPREFLYDPDPRVPGQYRQIEIIRPSWIAPESP